MSNKDQIQPGKQPQQGRRPQPPLKPFVLSGLMILGGSAFYLLNSYPILQANNQPAQPFRIPSITPPKTESEGSIFDNLPSFPNPSNRQNDQSSRDESQATDPSNSATQGSTPQNPDLQPDQPENSRSIDPNTEPTPPKVVRSLDRVEPDDNTVIMVPSPSQYECYREYRGGLACFEDDYRPNRLRRGRQGQTNSPNRPPLTDDTARRAQAELAICPLRYFNGQQASCGLR
ncbi:MAG: hypothetical protein ACFBSC_12015 [Microcoleaceae cyanobacterium]